MYMAVISRELFTEAHGHGHIGKTDAVNNVDVVNQTAATLNFFFFKKTQRSLCVSFQ
jgi:hypothetical protein